MNSLTPLFPALQILTPLGLPSTFGQWQSQMGAQQAGLLGEYLLAELTRIAHHHAHAIDQEYLRSPAFEANVMQTLRAAELAESGHKLRLLACALAGCALRYPPPSLDKFQTLRLLEQISERELGVLSAVLLQLDPFDPYQDTFSGGAVAGLSRQESEAAFLGLAQLGVLRPVVGGWQPTMLARQLALLSSR